MALSGLTPNSKRAVSRFGNRDDVGPLSPFSLDLGSVKRSEPACYSPLHSSQSATFSPRQVQCVGNYDLGKTIGRGRFGKVKMATHVLTGHNVAVKIIRKKNLTKEESSLLRREVDILKTLNHPHVIKLYEVLETERVLFLIMEYASGGEVLDFIVAHKKLSEKRARSLFRQLVSAFAHIHSRNIVHRDLKAENILLDENLDIKIIDFGLSNFFTPSQLLKTPCGSPSYAAPELIRKVDYDGPAADIWSLGVNLYVLVTGVLPFKPTDLVNLYDKVLKGEYETPDYLSNDCKDLLSKMLVVDPKERITIEGIMAHPWVQDPFAPPLVAVVEAQAAEEEVADPAIIQEMVRVGFKEDIARQSVKRNSCNPASATFSILMDRKRKRESLQLHKMVQRVQSEDLRPPPEQQQQAADVGWFARPARQAPIMRKRSKEAGDGAEAGAAQESGHKRTKSDDGKAAVTDQATVKKKENSLPADLSLPCLAKKPFPGPPSNPAPPVPLLDAKITVPSIAQRRLMRGHGHRRSHSVDVKHSEREEEKPVTTPIFNKMFSNVTKEREVKRSSSSVPANVSQLTAGMAERTEAEVQHGRSLTERAARPKTLTEEEAEEWQRSAEEEQIALAKHLEKSAAAADDESKTAFKMILSYTKRLLNKRAADEQQRDEPRQARAAFPNTMSTSKEPALIVAILEKKLRDMGMEQMRQDSFCLKVVSVDMNLQFEVEVCRMPRLTAMYCIRTKRVGGDWESYRSVCERLQAAVQSVV